MVVLFLLRTPTSFNIKKAKRWGEVNTEHHLRMESSDGKPCLMEFVWILLNTYHQLRNCWIPSTPPHGSCTRQRLLRNVPRNVWELKASTWPLKNPYPKAMEFPWTVPEQFWSMEVPLIRPVPEHQSCLGPLCLHQGKTRLSLSRVYTSHRDPIPLIKPNPVSNIHV